MTAVMKNEWRHFGSLNYFLAGAPAALSYTALNMSRSWAIETISVRMLVQLYERVKHPNRLYGLFLIEIAEKL